MAQISKRVLDSIRNLMSDVTIGFNARHASVASTYGVDPIVISFTADPPNALVGRIDPALIDQTTPITTPYVMVDTGLVRDTRDQKSWLFSGQIVGEVEWVLDFDSSDAITDFSSVANSIEDAMYQVFNSVQGLTDLSGNNVSYGGDLTKQPSPLYNTGSNWRRRLLFQGTFYVRTN